MPDRPDVLFAVATPGLEEVTAGELRDLRCKGVRTQPGGVAFRGDLTTALRTNLWLRTATRILLRVEAFGARRLRDLRANAAAVPWRRLLPTTGSIRVQATCRKSSIYHSGAAAQRVAEAVGATLGLEVEPAGADRFRVGTATPDVPEQRLLVRLDHDRAQLSLDTSGERLHRRGYRLETAKAPLRETLAAALLRLAGWRGATPLVDPLCGAGTLVIEAALLAARIPPGLGRTFALEAWPGFDPEARGRLLDEARARRRPLPAPVRGADRDAGAVDAARRNAERAGVGAEITFERAPLSALTLTPAPGLVVCNPPYGRRLGRAGPLRNLYATLGARLAAAPPGWQLALVTAAPDLARATGLPLQRLALPVPHGGLTAHLLLGKPPDATDVP